MKSTSDFAYEVSGKLEIPYKYYAGETGSMFLTTLRDRMKILGMKCDRCKTVFVPPRSICDRCYKRIKEWVEVGPAGTVTSFTVVRYREPHMPRKPPFVLALIKLDGANTGLTHLLGEVKPEEVKIGMRVEPIWSVDRRARITDIEYFRPVKEAVKPAKKIEAARPEAKPEKKTKKAAAKPAKKAGTKPVKKAAKKVVKKAAKKVLKKTKAKKLPKKIVKKATKKAVKKSILKKGKKAAKKAPAKTARKPVAKKVGKKKAMKKRK